MKRGDEKGFVNFPLKTPANISTDYFRYFAWICNCGHEHHDCLEKNLSFLRFYSDPYSQQPKLKDSLVKKGPHTEKFLSKKYFLIGCKKRAFSVHEQSRWHLRTTDQMIDQTLDTMSGPLGVWKLETKKGGNWGFWINGGINGLPGVGGNNNANEDLNKMQTAKKYCKIDKCNKKMHLHFPLPWLHDQPSAPFCPSVGAFLWADGHPTPWGGSSPGHLAVSSFLF